MEANKRDKAGYWQSVTCPCGSRHCSPITTCPDCRDRIRRFGDSIEVDNMDRLIRKAHSLK